VLIRNGYRYYVRLGESPEAQLLLSDLLSDVLFSQKHYGPRPEFERVNRVFQRLLADYPAKRVLVAIERWCLENTDMPTPSDIVRMVEAMRSGGGVDGLSEEGKADMNYWLNGE